DLANKFAGPRTFMPAVEEAIVAFYENLAQRVRPWQPTPSAPDGEPTQEKLEETDGPESSGVSPRQVVQRGQIEGRTFSIFSDGSVEIETASEFSSSRIFRNCKQPQLPEMGARGHWLRARNQPPMKPLSSSSVVFGCSSCGMCPQPSISRKVELGRVRLSLMPISSGTMRSWSHHRISVGSAIVLKRSGRVSMSAGTICRALWTIACFPAAVLSGAA